MRKIGNLFLIIATLMAPKLALADSSLPIGAGSGNCGKYLGESNKAVTLVVISWVQGFNTGMNVAEERPVDTALFPDDESVKAYIDKYCREYPLKTVIDASFSLHHELTKVR